MLDNTRLDNSKVKKRHMKKAIAILNLLLLLVLACAAGYFAFRARALGYENECLADDKAAFLVERSRLEISCAELEAKMNAALEEKAALGRNLVAAMKVCDTLRADASRAAAERDKTAEELAAAKRDLEVERKARADAEKRAISQAERDRIEQEKRAPLRVEQLKPLDPEKREKSDAKSLDELLELTTPGAGKEKKK